VIAHETGVTQTADPFGGSYFVERLTLDLEQAAIEYIRKIDEMGGMVAAIERGYPQREIAQAAYQYQRAIESGEKIIVGVNDFVSEEKRPIEILKIDESVTRHQHERLAELRKSRDHSRVNSVLEDLGSAASTDRNLMPYILECVRAYATVGEICRRLRAVFGVYQETIAL